MNLTPVKEMIEPRLFDNLNIVIGTLKQESKSLKLVKDEAFEDEKPTINITDSLIYRGLSSDRSSNKSMADYHVFFDQNIGIACFTDNLLSNPMGYMDQKAMEELHAKNRQTILQLLL